MRLIEPQPIFYVAGLAVDADGVFRAYHPTKDHQFYPVLRVGHLLSFLAMIRSAIVIPSAMADSSAGEGRPSQFANFRTARMFAAISSTRFRPSSMAGHQTVITLVVLRIRCVRSLKGIAFVRFFVDLAAGHIAGGLRKAETLRGFVFLASPEMFM
ncbi:MAG: hypothetical protein DMG76_09795 [Acidobacteria bacterium]|nr:MAG: hypothetical protein DMG76_09795 [Acidobacteriota bacterium]